MKFTKKVLLRTKTVHSYKEASRKMDNIRNYKKITIGKVYLKVVTNEIRETIFYSHTLDEHPGYVEHEKPWVLRNELKKFFVESITFHLEIDVYIPVGFKGETFKFTVRCLKNQFFLQLNLKLIDRAV